MDRVYSKSKKCLTVFVLVVFSLLCFTQGLWAKPELRVGMFEFAPCFYQEGDEVKGFIVDKLSKIVDRAGYDMSCAVYPMKRIREFLNTGVFDFTTCLTEVFGENEVVATEKMIYKLRLRAYTIGKKEEIKKVEDLSGKKIGIFRGFTYGGWINYIKDPKNNVQYYEVTHHEQLLQMLSLGRIDYVLNYRAPCDVVLAKTPIENLQYNEVQSFPVYMLASKKYNREQSKQIIQNLNFAYTQLLEEGQMVEER